MEGGMDQVHHQIFEKIAQDSGAPEAAGPGFVTGLSPQDEWLIRKRTAAASKLRHLPPELAYALTGEMPITDSPAANIELHRALERASSRGRSKLVGLGYGLPAAAAGAVLGHLLSGGDPYATAAGGAAAGGGVGYLAHRGEREGQRRLAGQLAGLRTQYQVAQQQAMAQQQEALMEQAQAEALQRQNGMMRGRKAGGQRKAAQANYNDAVIEQLRRRTRHGLPKQAGMMSGSLDDKRNFDASDPGRHYKPGLPWVSDRDREEVSAEAPTYIGRFGGERYGEADAELKTQVISMLASMRSMEKDSQGTGGGTGNQMAPTGAGPMKPPSPSGGGMGSAAQAPRLTSSPSAAGMAPKPPPGLSGQNTALQAQPKPKTYNLGPATNLASGAPPTVPTPPAHVASAMPASTGSGAVMPGGVTPL
jgi:hypothetical protein